MNYIYDKTYAGFLTCVYHHWYTEKAEEIFPEGDYQLDLYRYAMTVLADEDKAERVQGAIATRISKWDAQRVYQVFCSNEAEKEMKLLHYIALGFKLGSKIRLLHGDPVVKAVEATERRVSFEVHRLCGLIRFSEVQNIQSGKTLLYSKIEPDNDVLEFLAPHFSDRFKSEPFIIHDLRRGKALFACGRKWEIAALAPDVERSDNKNIDYNTGAVPRLEATSQEADIRILWKQYFEVMATRERTNPKCQRNFMPTRYWKHLTEIDGS